ncbi:MAG: apocytochrome f [Synechococcales cyanobacterium RM1_1_8]|nr:apocytochrome f [Synechococcales cyanobacterium RM1_1_8]
MRNLSFNLLTQGRRCLRWASRTVVVAALVLAVLAGSDLIAPQSAAAYPFWAQESYETPREATGKIVCANCHLAKKPVEVEFPQAVLPDTVFKGIVKIPYEDGLQQIQADGSKGGLNVGAVVMLPEGFTLAPEDRLTEELKEETEGVFYQTYAEDKQNIIIVGPLGGEENREIVFPILSPDPGSNKSVNFGKYSVHVGGNRGRGQVYPTGDASNNNAIKATAAGVVTEVSDSAVTIDSEAGPVSVAIPAGLQLTAAVGDTVASGTALTADPNVGGFGQHDVEIVLQSSGRIAGMLVFFAGVMLTQIMLVLKKKQVEKVQAAEMNF